MRREIYSNVSYVLLFVITLCSSTEYVPVYMWGTKNTLEHQPSPALQQISASSFKETLSKTLKAKNPRLVVFVEETLSPEDFARHDQKGNTAFVNLHKYLSSNNAEYKPYVENPIGAIKDLGKGFTEVSLAYLQRNSDEPKDEILIIDLNDAKEEEQRFQMLMRHDKIISEIIDDNNDNILAIYTAHHPSWVTPEEVKHRNARSLLQEAQEETAKTEKPKTEEEEKSKVEEEEKPKVMKEEEKPKHVKVTDKKDNNNKGEVIGDCKYLLLYVASSPRLSTDGGKKFEPIALTQESCTQETNKDVALTLSGGGNSYEFLIAIQPSGYWSLKNVTSGKISMSFSEISAPMGFSFHCNDQSFKNGDTVLSFPGIQLQAFDDKKDNQGFGDAYDCVGFTSIPIWSGLIVTAILLIILTLGITLMMDIRTMDKFDDAKGKTITINAGE